MQAWENFLNLLESELGAATVRKWLKPLKVLRFDACNIYLQANDSFQIIWFEEHIRKRAQTGLLNNNSRRIRVHIALENELPVGKRSKKKETEPTLVIPKFAISFDELDPLLSFEHFIVSPAHTLPFTLLCQTTGYNPETQSLIPGKAALAVFNPLYLYGPSGTGKTHLLTATALALKEQGLSVVYVRAETFTEHVVTAIRAGEMGLFRQSYRNTDVLIIDDVQLFSKKWATQEELFHTFNTLHIAGKQIILSANCPPSELQFIEPRLVSRFEWGISLPLELPQKEEVRKILQKKAASLNYVINPKISEFLIETFTSGTKGVSIALKALMLRTHLNTNGPHLTPTQLTIPFVQHQLSDLIMKEQETALYPEKIIEKVAEYFGIRPEDILGKAQSRDCVLPRQIAMHLCRIKLKTSYTKIGDLFNKDHSTVMSSVKVIQKGLDANDQEVVGPFQAILKKMKA